MRGDRGEDARVAELREGDFRAALDFVGEVHDAQDREEFRAILLPGYRTLVPALHVSYNEIEDGDRVTAAIVEPELPGWAVPAWERHAGENPLLRRYLRTRDGRALRFSDVLSRRELRGLPIYRHFYAPLGVEHQIAFILPSTPKLTIGVALTRTEEDFSERDRRLLELTRPHMIQAYRAAELRERLAATVAGLRSGIDADATALVLLGPGATVTFASAAAEEMFAEHREQLREGSPLPRALADWLSADAASGSLALEDRVLLVRRLRSDGRVVLVLSDPAQALAPEALIGLGLTPREAAVLRELALGAETAVAAERLGIAPRTLAKHLQRINTKLGVRDRGQAVATAWAAAGPAAPWEGLRADAYRRRGRRSGSLAIASRFRTYRQFV
jgi:DNA-binding CsgD family transcriptional regulator